MEYFLEILKTTLWYALPIWALFLIFVLIRKYIPLQDYISRKILHLIAVAGVIPLILVPVHWWVGEITIGICAVLLIALLLILERFDFYKKIFIEKFKHEIVVSFIIYFTVMASLIAFFWGYRGEGHKYYAMIAIFCWGLGDAGASVFGHIFGEHKFKTKLIEEGKSVEGSAMCFTLSLLISLLLLVALDLMVWWLAIIEAVTVGIVVCLTELFSRKGLDNLTCPIMAGLVLFLFSLI